MSNTVTGNYIGTNAAARLRSATRRTGCRSMAGPGTTALAAVHRASATSSAATETGVSIILGSGTMSNRSAATTSAPMPRHGCAQQHAGRDGDRGAGPTYNRIGGSTPGERNIISGNGGRGVVIRGSGTMSNTVSGNYIGTNASGTASLPNAFEGVCGRGPRQTTSAAPTPARAT